MRTKVFLRIGVSLIAFTAFLALPFMLLSHAGLPMQITHWGMAEQQIQPRQGAPLPLGLQPGDILDWPNTDLRTRAALEGHSLSAGQVFIVHVRRNGMRLSVPIETMDLSSSKLVKNDLVFYTFLSLLDLVLCLATLWWGRNWSAWGVSLLVFSDLMKGALLQWVATSPIETWALTGLADTIFSPLSMLGYYIMAESIAAEGLNRRVRLVARCWMGAALLLIVLSLLNFNVVLLITGSPAWVAPFTLNSLQALVVFPPLFILAWGLGNAPLGTRVRIRWFLTIIACVFIAQLASLIPGVDASIAGRLMLHLVYAACALAALYALFRHRLISVSVIINRALVYAGTSAIVLGMLAATQNFIVQAELSARTSIVLEIMIPLLIGIAFSALRKRIDRYVEWMFFRKRRNAEIALRTFAEQCAYIEMEKLLLDRAVDEVAKHTGALCVAFYKRNNNGYRSVRHAGSIRLPEYVGADDPAFLALRATRKTIDLDGMASLLGTEGCIFPMAARGVLDGALLCGPRPGEKYSKSELDLLAYVSQQVGSALHSLLLEKRARFVEELASGALPALADTRVRAEQLVSDESLL